ncbi:MAG: hypothetical protein KDN22_02395 [Verrucomicrobiae bacterium]|nr:hypothetical protein [Verrucomicrobiae bacterium]
MKVTAGLRFVTLATACTMGIGCSVLPTPGNPDIATSNPAAASARQSPQSLRRAPAASVKVKVARPAPGKNGFVVSPYSKEPRLVDVRNVPPGTRVRDPYSGQYFEVP